MFKHICNTIDVSNLTEVSGTLKLNEAKHVFKHMNGLPCNVYLLKDGKNCWVFVTQEIVESKGFLFISSCEGSSYFREFPFLVLCLLTHLLKVCITLDKHFSPFFPPNVVELFFFFILS